ncbi:MAG TPA: amidohydrolase [Thermomicrobiales bacterium]|nr:amidohydrolase [Thermomicrobiales bacterium]
MMAANIAVPEEDIIRWRRHIHAHPELSFKEVHTSQYVADQLGTFGHIEVTRPTATSVVGLLRGTRPGKMVALRADMDALPLQEETGVAYASQNDGVAHACGHDAHTAMLLGAAKVLAGLTDQIAGNVKFIFQHAEEQPPGGAQELVQAGVVDDVDAIFGLHVMNQATGTIRIPRGTASTSADGFYLNIQGRGSHGSMPQDGIDPILVGSQLVLGLNTIPSRSVDPSHMVVVSVGTFQSGDAPNVIPDMARLGVSIRTKTEADRQLVRRRAEEIIKGTCASYGAGYNIQWIQGYAAVQNDDTLVNLALKAAGEAIGKDQVSPAPASSASEDFSAYTAKVPGCFMFLGGGTAADGLPYKNHNPRFNIVERALANGTCVEVQIVLDMLGQK